MLATHPTPRFSYLVITATATLPATAALVRCGGRGHTDFSCERRVYAGLYAPHTVSNAVEPLLARPALCLARAMIERPTTRLRRIFRSIEPTAKK